MRSLGISLVLHPPPQLSDLLLVSASAAVVSLPFLHLLLLFSWTNEWCVIFKAVVAGFNFY